MKFLFNTMAVGPEAMSNYYVYRVDQQQYHVESVHENTSFALFEVDGLWITYNPQYIVMAQMIGARISSSQS